MKLDAKLEDRERERLRQRLERLDRWADEERARLNGELRSTQVGELPTIGNYRDQLLARLRTLRQGATNRNEDLSDEDIAELADRFSREFGEELLAAGKIRFEE